MIQWCDSGQASGVCGCGGVLGVGGGGGGLFFFFFNDTATTEIYTLSLHDALPICLLAEVYRNVARKRIAQVDLGTFDHKHQGVGTKEIGRAHV